MKKHTFIALGLFVVLLGGYLATRETQVSVGVRKLELPAFEAAKVSGLQVNGPVQVVLKREGEGWAVLDPATQKQFAADGAQVEGAISALRELKGEDFVTDRAEKHAELEVDDGKALRVKVQFAAGPELELLFGRMGKSGGNYVRRAGKNEVFVAKGGFAAMMRKQVNGWRKRTLFPAKYEELARVTVRHGDGSPYTLKAGETGGWSLEPGAPTAPGFRFDAGAAQRVVQQLASLAAQDFLEGDLDVKDVVVVAELKDGKKLELRLGPPAEVEQGTHASALLNAFDALDASKDGKLSGEELAAAAGRKDAKPAAGVDDGVRRAAQALVQDPKRFELFDVGRYAGLPKDGALSRDDLNGVARTAQTVLTRVEGDPQVYLVPGYAAAQLAKRLTELRDTSLLAFDSSKVKRVEVQAQTGAKKVVVEKVEGAWKLLEPKKLPEGYVFEPSQVDAQLATWSSARASRWVEGVNEAKAGLAKPSASLEIRVDGGPTQVLRFGSGVEGPGGAKEVYVKGSVDGAIYQTAQYEKGRLEQGLELFKKPPPPPAMGNFPPRGLESLPPDIRAKLEAQLRQQGVTP